MKTIKISYIEIRDNPDNSLISLSLDYPKFRKIRKCYLYEIKFFPEINEKINVEIEDKIKYSQNIYSDFYIKISETTLEDLKKYLIQKTDYEEHKFNDSLSLLQALMNVYRNDPKSWSCD